MIDADIRQYIDQTIADTHAKAQFDVAKNPFHTHNNIDSAPIPYMTIFGKGPPLRNATKGTLYVNITATTATTRLYINIDGSKSWANFTASA